MRPRRVHLKSDGALLLGEHVSCDGFSWKRPVRVQTHIHMDHMMDFDTSKANQTIVMSRETLALLKALFNADLPYRSNLHQLEPEARYAVDGELIELLPSHHMLGSVQVRVTCKDGYRVGYSSDFFWPLESAIQVDELVVDATYGDPTRTRRFDQQLADDCLEQAAAHNLARGVATACVGHNGRLQHALHLLSHMIRWPIICSPRAFRLMEVYRSNAYSIPEVLESTAPEAITILRERQPCFAFATLHERRHLPWVDRMRKITLSAYMSSNDHPLTRYDNGDCCVALTDHADFNGTMEFIRATGARAVYTNPRSGNAVALADAVRQQLGVHSEVIEEIKSHEWG
jgi:putative mRNA 3-end processing factor